MDSGYLGLLPARRRCDHGAYADYNEASHVRYAPPQDEHD
ncbi:hypothetical protein K788_0000323 [Paraburkholderia caribensis MBA4]|uniref:Uncharacterized protein n=1 Tax=Paraburkholderia caribensis MBA4 TaxID=1323664 RepID=A0A0N7JVA3_9BURK|nr:hypothetical protein K788_0000323 [Paraburkholderia caribensis MBA4]